MDLRAALALGRELVQLHGLDDWVIQLDRAKTRAGACRPRTRTISLSGYLTHLHPESEVRDTILHEIAHALVGVRHGHDAVWRAKALEIGCSGERCSSEDAPRLEGPWAGTCPRGHVVTRHRRPTRVGLCGRCRGPEHDRVLEWTYAGERVDMHPNYVAELEAFLRGVPSRAPGRLGPGEVVRVSASGQYHGVVGSIVKRGRTRYHVRTPRGVLTVPFALVELLD
jgi:predicted SprT family Zn-dependent metalloprotease